MITLETLQQKLNADYELFNVLNDCEEMIENDSDKRAITAYLQMAVQLYGIERTSAVIKNYGFEKVKEFIGCEVRK